MGLVSVSFPLVFWEKMLRALFFKFPLTLPPGLPFKVLKVLVGSRFVPVRICPPDLLSAAETRKCPPLLPRNLGKFSFPPGHHLHQPSSPPLFSPVLPATGFTHLGVKDRLPRRLEVAECPYPTREMWNTCPPCRYPRARSSTQPDH